MDALKKLYWVKDVTLRELGCTIVTKPNTLRTKLTHSLKKSDLYFSRGKKLSSPIWVFLPSYRLELGDWDFMIDYNKEPKKRIGNVGSMYPAYGQSGWGSVIECAPHTPCLGNYEELYVDADGYLEKANVIAEYLQYAIPDGGTWLRSIFAYSNGLVGDEIIQPARAKTKNNE